MDGKCQKKLPVSYFQWVEDISEFNEDFIKSYNDESDERYFPEVDDQYPENLDNLHNDLPFLPKRMKIEKTEKLVAYLHDKEEYIIHIMNFTWALNYGLGLSKVHRIIKFNQTVWLKPYINMNTNLKKKQEMILKKNFYINE